MYFRYGNYTHAFGEVQLKVRAQSALSARGLKALSRVTWNCNGVLKSNDGTIATLTTQLNTLCNAYGFNPVTGNITGAADFQNAVLLYDDLVTPTIHQLNSGSSLSGVHVTSFNFDNNTPAEYSTYRNYSFSLEAVFADPSVNVIDFQETFELNGTGESEVVWVESLEGEPQPQTASQFSLMSARQYGHAVGAFSYPKVPDPIYDDPVLEQVKQRKITVGPVRQVGQNLYEYPVSWSYSFLGGALPGALPNTPKS